MTLPDGLLSLVVGMAQLDLDIGKIRLQLGLGADGLLAQGEFVVKIGLDRLDGFLHLDTVGFVLFGLLLELARE